MTRRASREFLTWGLRLVALAAVGWAIFYFYWTIQILQMIKSLEKLQDRSRLASGSQPMTLFW
jgi:hypothetical protein